MMPSRWIITVLGSNSALDPTALTVAQYLLPVTGWAE